MADPYGWMRDDTRTNPEVLDHIEKENVYTKQQTSHLNDLEVTLQKEYQEASYSGKGEDTFNIYNKGEYLYYSKRLPDKPYALHYRKSHETGIESLLLDENTLVKDTTNSSNYEQYLAIHTVLPSPSDQKIAYSIDMVGNELCAIFILDINTGNARFVDKNTSGVIVWGTTDDTIYYVQYDSDTSLRPCHWMEWTESTGTDKPTIRHLMEETDDRYWCGIRKTCDENYLLWICASEGNTKIWAMDLQRQTIDFVDPYMWRETKEHDESWWYDIEHGEKCWWMICSNEEGPEVQTLFVKQDGCDDQWRQINWLDHLESNLDTSSLELELLQVFSGFLVLKGTVPWTSKNLDSSAQS